MAKILSFEGKRLPEIEGYVIYDLHGAKVMRKISGFKSKDVLHHPKYQKSRENSTEFGNLSHSCKVLRVGLDTILPKNKNRPLTNAFTKKMHPLIYYDYVNPRGKRHLMNAMHHVAAKAQLVGFDFNPETTLFCTTKKVGDFIKVILAPLTTKGTNIYLGCRTQVLEVDADYEQTILYSGIWSFSSTTRLKKEMTLKLPDVAGITGMKWYLVELAYFYVKDSGIIEYNDGSKAVVVVGF